MLSVIVMLECTRHYQQQMIQTILIKVLPTFDKLVYIGGFKPNAEYCF